MGEFMIDLTAIKEGDTVVFRNGGRDTCQYDFRMGCLAVGGFPVSRWFGNGRFYQKAETGFDIIEIIKPKPVVKTFYLTTDDDSTWQFASDFFSTKLKYKYKITLTDGEPTIESI